LAKINSFIQQAHVKWLQLDKEMMDDLIMNGQSNVTDYILFQKPTGLPSGEADNEEVHITVAQVWSTTTLHQRGT